MSWAIQESSKCYPGLSRVIQGSSPGHPGVIPGSSRGHPGIIQGSSKNHPGIIQGSSGDCPGQFSDTVGASGGLPGFTREHLGCAPKSENRDFGKIPGQPRLRWPRLGPPDQISMKSRSLSPGGLENGVSGPKNRKIGPISADPGVGVGGMWRSL